MTNSAPRFLTLSLTLIASGLLLSGCDAADIATDPTAASHSEEIAARSHGEAPTGPDGSNELASVRSATAQYQDVSTAVADGYAQFSPHVPNMGIHYLNDEAIGVNGMSALDRSLDPRAPEILVYVDDAPRSPQRRLVAVEYAIPKEGDAPPAQAADLFAEADAEDWHVHPSTHELPLSDEWTIHGECHYRGGIGVFLAESPDGDFVLWTPPTGPAGSWSGTVAPDQCPESLGEQPLPELLIAHGKWWTLHAWIWAPNPEGVFHSTNPRIAG